MLDIIVNNPFRVLGVYSNTRTIEIVRNVGKINAFTNVAKEVVFPTDLTDYVGPVCRDNESVTAAQSKISTKEDKVRYALFWFVNASAIDESGLEIARQGRFWDAYMFWQEEGRLINRAVTSLLGCDYRSAIQDYMYLFHWNRNRKDFLSIVAGDDSIFTATELSHILLDELLKAANPNELVDVLQEIGDFPCKRYPLISYAKIYGKMRIGTFVDSEGNEKKRCLFVNNDQSIKYVDFGSSLGVLSPTEIVTQKNNLFVNEYAWGPVLEEWDYHCVVEIDYIKDYTIKQPIAKIHNTICAFSKAWSEDNTESGRLLSELIRDTHRDLLLIKDTVGEDDIRYMSNADKIAKELVNCIPYYFSHSTLPELDRCSHSQAYLDFAENLSSLDSIKELIQKHRRELLSIRSSYLSSLPPSVDIEKDRLNSLLEEYYKAHVEVTDFTLVVKNEEGKYVNKRFQDRPTVSVKRKSPISYDDFLHRCAPILFDIKRKLEPSLESYAVVSDHLVRDLYNELVYSVNARLKAEEQKYETYLSLRSKYAGTEEYFEAKYALNPLSVFSKYPEIDKLLDLQKEYGDDSSYRSSSYTYLARQQKRRTSKGLKEYLGQVLNAMNNLAQFDMDRDFRTKYFEPNYQSIRSMFYSIIEWSAPDVKEADIDMKTEREKEEERKSKTLWGRIKKSIKG